jgi:hypothetical protein
MSGKTSTLFSSSFAKVERAKTQLDDLNAKITEFFAGNPYEQFSQVNRKKTEEVWRFRLTSAIPPMFAVIAGEILYNLRSALDQMACSLAIAHSGSSKETYFPFGKTRDIFKDEIRKKTKKLPRAARPLIRATKPYPRGNALLWALHDLNRRDKHIELIAVNVHSKNFYVTEIKAWGKIIRVGSRRGAHMLHDGKNFIQHDESKKPIFRKEGDARARIEFAWAGNVCDEKMEFLTCTPGTHFEADFHPCLNVAFGDIKILKHEPVVAVLEQMRQLVERVLLTFDGRFS